MLNVRFQSTAMKQVVKALLSSYREIGDGKVIETCYM